MNDLDLLIDLFRDAPRQGPGGVEETRLAVALSGLRKAAGLKIADIGCGSGASTLVLAEELNASVVAVDLVPEFLAALGGAAAKLGLGERIETLIASMDSLPFKDLSLDAIWSEGAIYNIGFENGVASWRRFLKPGGILAVSELTWLTSERPSELERHWAREYPEVNTASAKMQTLEKYGFTPVGYFPLPERCWLDNFYRPLQERFPHFLARNENSDRAQAVVAAEEAEIKLFESYSPFVSYGCYIARKNGA